MSAKFKENIQLSGGFKSSVLKQCHCKSLMLNCDFDRLLLRTCIHLVMGSVLVTFLAELGPDNCLNYD